MQTKKKAAIHERKILTDRQLFSLKLLCLRCGQNFIIDQLIGLIKCFDHLGRFRMEIDFIQRFGFGRVPDSAFQDILVDACAVTKAGVGMAGGVGRIGGKLPGKLRFALTIFVVRIRLDADFLQERIEFAVTPVLFIQKPPFPLGKSGPFSTEVAYACSKTGMPKSRMGMMRLRPASVLQPPIR